MSNNTKAYLVGAGIGSFLNVVIYRLPKMLERQWAAECASLAEGDAVPYDYLVVATGVTLSSSVGPLARRKDLSGCARL